ncbi:uncharacterized protein LOC120843931 [Ixodes scapularis]|uniref:uncharacterized protein LOC120843931 n=1 Tax=Ixodes scapularis TaxID=6945 RepID=UPI001A9CEB1A|nr:uncharacterized protein LOC120843931 [Ixodes scapularis]
MTGYRATGTLVLWTFARAIEYFAASSFEQIPHCVSTEWCKDFTPRQCSWFPSAFECSLLVAGVDCPKERAEARKCGTNLVLAIQAKDIINQFLKNQGQIPEMSVEEISLMALKYSMESAEELMGLNEDTFYRGAPSDAVVNDYA